MGLPAKGEICLWTSSRKKSLQTHRKQRSSEGRERYLDMVQRERALMLEQGIARSTEQLLDMAGAFAPSEAADEGGIKDRATGRPAAGGIAGAVMASLKYSPDRSA
ncbi:MAG: hypothetical protein LRY54_00980 [Alphaproteobacteria bacterium]|nr:hypothetical protein [Alphaproteobacteria bacterium]